MSSSPQDSPNKELIKAFEAGGVVDYLQYLQSRKRIMLTNFLAGISRGFGIVIGMTVVLAIFIWILAQLVSLPFVGEFFEKVEGQIQEYMEKTNYTDEFQEMNRLLKEISENTRQQKN